MRVVVRMVVGGRRRRHAGVGNRFILGKRLAAHLGTSRRGRRSDDRAEKAYMEVLKRDPNFTPAMVHLATLYKDKGKDDEAKKWAQKVIDFKGSSVPNDYRKFDKHDAEKILKELAE